MAWKRFIAKVLVAATVVTSVDLYWVDLSGCNKVFASIADCVTDSYEAYDKLYDSMDKISKADDPGDTIASELGLNIRENDTPNTNASELYPSESTWKRSDSNVINGLYTFNQKAPTTTAQVKSGEWLDKSKYEAMAGTPTTEPLFVNMGGTQWIVDLQYRYVNAPYEREWKLEADYNNYRYYKLGEIEQPEGQKRITYRATQVMKFDQDPEKTFVLAPNGTKVTNFAYNFFEGVIDPDTQEYREKFKNNGSSEDKSTILTVTYDDLSSKSHTVKTYAADHFAVEKGGSAKWSSNKVAPIQKGEEGNISENLHPFNGEEPEDLDFLSSHYKSPNVARAIEVKTEIYNQLKAYIQAWKEQDDNYRVDNGTYDIDFLDSDMNQDDKLTFMYTYEGMVRHGTKKAEGDVLTQRASKGDTHYSDSILYPSIVTYFHDWQQYTSMNNMDVSYGSKSYQFEKKLSAYGDPYQIIVDSLNNPRRSISKVGDDKASYFPLYVENIPEHKGASIKAMDKTKLVTSSEDLPADMSFAEEAAKRVGSSVCIALGNKEQIPAFGDNGDYAFNLTSEEIGTPNDEQNTGRDLNSKGWCDLPTLYYRAIYSILLNYGCMFYRDELNDLFKNNAGVIGNYKLGFSIEATPGISDEKYNEHVNACLAAIFGQGPNLTAKDHTTYLPLATFPWGGDLDGEMDDDDPRRAHSYIHAQDPKTFTSVTMHMLHYTYGAIFKITDAPTTNQSKSFTSQDFVTRDHKTDTHEGEHNLPRCESDYQEYLCDFTTGKCTDTEHTMVTHCDVAVHEGGNCVGSWSKDSRTEVSGNSYIWQCKFCGQTVGPFPSEEDLSNTPDTTPYKHICKKCNGNPNNVTVKCSQPAPEYHTHYFMEGATARVGETVAPTLSNHSERVYTYECEIFVQGTSLKNVTGTGESGTMWVEGPKGGSYSDSLIQKFKNVQWLDVTSYTLWQMHNGSVKGLSALLAEPISTPTNIQSSAGDIVTKAVDQMGYTVYNNVLDCKTESTQKDPLAANTVLSNVRQHEWESLGVLANSWNLGSRGNLPENVASYSLKETISAVKATPKKYPYSYIYNKADVPILQAYSSDVSVNNFVNTAPSAFQVKSITSEGDKQVVYLEYHADSQGGRSHTTFNGFYNQALADTFYFGASYDADGTYSSQLYKYSYGNSLRIQGDYLSLDKTNGDKLTMAGMQYDTWDERFSQYKDEENKFSHQYSSGKFALLPNGYNELSIFASTCKWIPARLSIIFSRQAYNNLYGNANGITNTADCWIIHSYCEGINGIYHTPWDGVSGAMMVDGQCLGKNCFGKWDATGCETDKGSVNPKTHHGEGSTDPMPGSMPSGDACVQYKNAQIGYWLNKPIKLRNVLNGGRAYYDQFEVLKWDGTTSHNKAVTIKNGAIVIELNHYLSEGRNEAGMMTAAVSSNTASTSLENTMPYLGYQSAGIGTKLITMDGGGGTQRGYSPGYVSVYNPESTFVSESPMKDGFIRFGVTPPGKVGGAKPVLVGNKYYRDSMTDDFSKYYPWLAYLNVNRYIANGYYKTGQAAVHYSNIASVAPPSWANTSLHISSGNLDGNMLRFITRYIKEDDRFGGSSLSKSLSDKWSAYKHLNSIVIYNPVSTQSAHIVTPTKYLPDAANKGEFKKIDETDGLLNLYGHVAVKRDTRVAYNYQLTADTEEQYLSGNGIASRTSRKKEREERVLKKKSDIRTEAYITSDYHLNRSANRVEFLSEGDIVNNESYIVDQVGEYSLTRISTPTNWISATVNLMRGDIISFSEKSKAVVLEMGTNNFTLPWSNIESAYRQLQKRYKKNLPEKIEGEEDVAENLPDGIEREKIQTVIDYTTTDVGVPLYKNMFMSIGGTLSLRAGSLIKVSLNVSESGENGSALISDALELDKDGLHGCKVYSFTEVPTDESGNNFTYTWYIEAVKDTMLYGIPITVKKDCFLWHTENILESEKVFLMSLASTTQPTPINVTSYTFFHEGGAVSDGSATKYTAYNKNVVDLRSEYRIDGADEMSSAGLYIGLNGGGFSASLKDEALLNPHKVPNTDWRYYVLGWHTKDGDVIASPEYPDLMRNNTVLITETNKSITVGEIISKVNSGTLAAYRDVHGNYGLIDLSSDKRTFERKSKYTGYTVKEGTFDIIPYGNDELTVKTGKAFSGGKPWSAYGSPSGEGTQGYAFECVFKVTNATNRNEINNVNNIAYDVMWSNYVGHRWNYTVVDKCSCCNPPVELWTHDWDVETVTAYDFDIEEFNAVFADTLSIDDEYTIYWDNYSDLVPKGEGTASNIKQTTTHLGRGWDCPIDGASSNKISSEALHNKYWSTYIKEEGNADPTVTDTTKWIYSKYVIFNVDMYAFTPSADSYVYDDKLVEQYDPDRQIWDPTTPAFKEDGTPNKIVYIRAGQRVYLGKYDTSTESPSLEEGRFHDYGEGKNYTYHFWVPLSDGESDSNVTATYVVNAINGIELNGEIIQMNYKNLPDTWDDADKFPTFNMTINPMSVALQRWGLVGADDVTPTKIKDEWGNPVMDAYGVSVDNNREYITETFLNGDHSNVVDIRTYEGYTRSGNSLSYQTVSLLGRVGGLTVFDTGDPRYQDTFKDPTGDGEPSEDDSNYWAVAPIVRAIIKYSNDKDKHGSQLKYLTDVVDIRGRYLQHGKKVDEEDCGMTTAKSADTYGNISWWKAEGNNDNRAMLPFDHTFNVHEEIRNSVTPSKLGYEVYCTLDTIGNYYGSNGRRPNEDGELEDNDTNWVNNNLDYGQTKIQVHPMYVACKYNKDTGKWETQPVDVYMKKGSSYSLINAGSQYISEEEALAHHSDDKGPYYLTDCFDATYTSVIDTNKDGTKDTDSDGTDDTYKLDQNMLRKSITSKEAKVTYDVVHSQAKDEDNKAFKFGVTTSILDPNNYNSEDLGGTGLDYKYVYGNAQMLFLREWNRTFTGGTTLALNQDKSGIKISDSCDHIEKSIQNAERYAQKWYFGVGLPASAKFVPHGMPPIDSSFEKIDENYYILTLVDVFAVGEKWGLHYESPVSKETIDIGEPLTVDEWNVYKDTFPYAIPVCIYDLSKTDSSSDQQSRGSH